MGSSAPRWPKTPAVGAPGIPGRAPGADPLAVRAGLAGQLRTGRKPLLSVGILSVGNADGEVQMLTTARFTLLIRHDDANREFAYDTGAEKALAAAEPGTRRG